MSLCSVRKSIDNSCCFRPLIDGSKRVVLEITRNCNLRCKHCMAPFCENDEQIDHNRLVKLMQELSENNISKIMFTGGEPLLVDNIFNYIKIASQNNILVDINTNLTLLNKEMIQKMIECGVSEVTTSIDGDENIHCQIRNNKYSYNKTITSIKELISAGIKVDVVCTVMQTNKFKLKEVAEKCEELGVSSLTFSGLILEGRAEKSEGEYNLQEVMAVINNLRQQFKLPIRTVRLCNNDYSVCHKGMDMIGIDYLGNVHPCLQDKIENPLNIKNHSLKDCINNVLINLNQNPCSCYKPKKNKNHCPNDKIIP